MESGEIDDRNATSTASRSLQIHNLPTKNSKSESHEVITTSFQGFNLPISTQDANVIAFIEE